MRRPFFSRFHALAVNDCGCRTCLAPGRLAAQDVKRVMNARQRAAPVPEIEIVVDRALGRQVLGDRAPLTTRAQHIEQTVDHLTKIDRALRAALLCRWYQALDQRPFFVGQITRVTQRTAVIATTVFAAPHRDLPNQETTVNHNRLI